LIHSSSKKANELLRNIIGKISVANE